MKGPFALSERTELQSALDGLFIGEGFFFGPDPFVPSATAKRTREDRSNSMAKGCGKVGHFVDATTHFYNFAMEYYQ